MDDAERQTQAQLLAGLGVDVNRGFPALVVAYQDRLYTFALRLAGNGQDAEETVQDALLRAYRALCRYPAERIAALALRPWLYRITRNVYRNRIRRQRIAVLSLDQSSPEDNDAPLGEPADAENERPEARAVVEERRVALAAGLLRLPERQRAAVVLRHVEGLSYAEVAVALDVAEGTAKSDVHRGLQRLRRVLDQAELV